MNSSFNKNFSRNFRRLFLLAAMLALLAAVFSGCMKKETPEATTDPSTEPPLLIEPTEEATETTEATEPEKPEANITIEGKMITISGAPVEVRSAAGPDGLVIGKLEVGTQAEVLRQVEFQDGVRWALVRDGWICLDNLDLEDGPVTEPEKPEGVDVVPPATDAAVDPPKPPRPSENNKPAPTPETNSNQSTAGGNGVVRANSGLKVRSEPSTDSKVVGGLKNGARVTILEQRDGWGRVSDGWVSMKYVSLDGGANVPSANNNTNNNNNTHAVNTPVNNSANAMVTASELNVRTGPGTNNAAVAKYYNGTRIEILEKKDGWGRTKDGWVSMNYVYEDGSVGEGSGSGVITADHLNIRKGPGTKYDTAGSLSAGDGVNILAQFQVGNTKWGCINQGWISMDYVKMG